MKKIILFLLLARSIFAQDLFGTKIYINPGHGGLDAANDRYVPQTGFWESVSNLDKGLALRSILQQIKATVYMSRVANSDADDLPLSQIVSDCNSKNVDYFHAIHSNGFDGKSNYTLLLFQGKTNSPTYPGSLTMSNYVVDEIYKANRTTNKMIAGDFDFYGTGQAYLGVFKGLNVPGTLSEGEFHDYIPESWRLMNISYKKHEAWAIARGFLKYFLQPGFQTGIIAGLVRDMNKTVSYFALTSKNDQKLPLNNIKVTLQPGDKVYNGDANNNGFFLFDSLAPGSYKVYYEAPGYYKDSSSTITVAANATSFADKNLLFDTTAVAQILSFSPSSPTDSVKTIASISIRFDLPMDIASTNAAFQLSPVAQGVFTWSDENKLLTFNPSLPYLKSTEYTVTLSQTAKTKWNIPLGKDLTFKFITKNRDRLNLLSTYPLKNQEGISPSFFGKLQFDAPILSQSVSGNILLYTSNNELVSLGIITTSVNGIGIISFQPQSSLEINSIYRLVIGDSLKDSEGIPTVSKDTISFKIISENYISGTVIDSFEVVGQWKNPGLNPGSVGIDSVKSTINVTYSIKYSGTKGGRLAYVFTQLSGGVCQFYDAAKPAIGSESAAEFGIWVKGDLSNNILEYWFSDENNATSEVKVDTINWSGWLLKRISKSTIGGSGQKYFNSIVVKQTPEGLKNSSIYVDDAQYDILLPVEDQKNSLTPERLALYQNYPNPFNPTTVISYQLPENNFVSLKVFDVLGNEVVTLANELQQAGRHNYELGIKNYKLSSGVYFYQLRAGNFVQTKKMILMK